MKKKIFTLVFFSLAVAVLTFLIYRQTGTFAFIPSDDMIYVCGEPHVTNGVTVAGLKWAFTTQNQTCNWHPLTFISLMVDVSVFGVTPGPTHLHNVILHLVNSVLLFIFLLMLLSNASFSPSQNTSQEQLRREDIILLAAFMGTLFWSLHPHRAESVAWISSRKDVLCGFWYLLGHIIYLKALVSQDREGCFVPISWKTFVFVLVAFIFAFMAKPTAIVYAGTLLLMEYGIRRRWGSPRVGVLIVFTLACAVITVSAQQAAISNKVDVISRMLNAIACIGEYLRDAVFPLNLCLGYPYKVPVESSRLILGVAVCVFLIYKVTSFLKKLRESVVFKRDTWLSLNSEAPLLTLCNMGIFWFLMALVPVIGVLQVGSAARADRYTYLPAIGLSIILVWAIQVLGSKTKGMYVLTAIVGAISLLFLFILGYEQVSYWKNNTSIFFHSIHVSRGNLFAYKNLAVGYVYEKEYWDALKSSVELTFHGSSEACLPTVQPVLFAVINAQEQQVQEQQDILNVKIDLKDPWAFEKNYLLAYIASCRGLNSSAEAFLKTALQIQPDNIIALKLESQLLFVQGQAELAEEKLLIMKNRYPKAPYIDDWLKFVREKKSTGQSF